MAVYLHHVPLSWSAYGLVRHVNYPWEICDEIIFYSCMTHCYTCRFLFRQDIVLWHFYHSHGRLFTWFQSACFTQNFVMIGLPEDGASIRSLSQRPTRPNGTCVSSGRRFVRSGCRTHVFTEHVWHLLSHTCLFSSRRRVRGDTGPKLE